MSSIEIRRYAARHLAPRGTWRWTVAAAAAIVVALALGGLGGLIALGVALGAVGLVMRKLGY